jgi:class 3 adenylate cyclase/tetratricopeptide (TPR) repeat protein
MPACVACGALLPAGARFCPACAAPVEAPPSEERKLATVLFADLVGSTELGAQDPERTRVVLDRFYDAMAAEVEAAGGTVEKFVGDAVMAAFGAPAAQEDHAERALHAALAMRRRLEELFGDGLALRIGVNTGEVVVGRPREGSSFVTGDAVNVAARLEQAAEPGEILAGERTVAAARGAFEFGRSETVEAKGKAGGVLGRPLVRSLSLMRPRGVSGLRRVFVGRDAELDVLKHTYGAACEDGKPRLVTIMGDAGVGKTRVVRELWEWLSEQSPEPLRRTGRCLSYGQGITYWPLAEALKEHLGISESDPPEAILRHLEGREILGLTLGLDVSGDLHPLVARDRMYETWVRFLEELATERPTVLLVEDIHWAEEPLLDLLDQVVSDVEGPLMLLATARPELHDARPRWVAHRAGSTVLQLERLSARDATQMLDELLGGDLPAPLSHVVVERAEGNPFFVEELIGMLIDRGLLERTNGGWSVRDSPDGFAIPDSVQAVLAARIDLLDAPEKAALQAASVIGRTFWAGPVYELVARMEPSLRVLEERDFVRRRSGSSLPGEQEFAIKHALTREVAYASLPKAKRARLHAAFAAWLERTGGGRDEHASLLAHHYAEAARPDDADLAWADDEAELERLRGKAIAWLRRAAELATGRYEAVEALSMLDRALALEPGDRERIELLRQLAEVYMLNYEVERYQDTLEEALALGPDRTVAADIYANLALYGYGRPYMWKQAPTEEVGKRWVATALELAGPGTEAEGLAHLARALARPAGEDAREAAERALAIGEQLANERLAIEACEAHALIASVTGRFQEACQWAERSLEQLPTLDDPGLRAHQYWLGGFVYLRGGRTAEVPPLSEAYDRLTATLTAHDRVHAIALRALFESSTGGWPILCELTPHVQAAAEANEDTPCQFNWRSLLVCALGLEHLGEEDEARRLETKARAAAVVAGPPEREPALLRLALLRGDLEEALRILEHLPPAGDAWGLDAAAARLDALAALDDRSRVEQEAAPFLDEQSYTRPFAFRALGLVRRDQGLLAEAASDFEAIGLEWRADETRALLPA